MVYVHKNQTILHFEGGTVQVGSTAVTEKDTQKKIGVLTLKTIEPVAIGDKIKSQGGLDESEAFLTFNDPKSIDVIIEQLNKVKSIML